MALLTNLEAYWKFDESSGSSAADATGNGHTGTATGTTVGVTGKISLARQYARNTSDQVSVPHDAALMSAAFSIQAWIYITSDADAFVRIFEKGGASTSGGYGLEWNGAGTPDVLKFVIWGPGGAQGVSTAGTLSLNTWYHIVGTFDSGTAILYLNGVLSGSNSGYTLATNTDALLFGKFQPDTTHTFDGTIDEGAYWSRALTSAEITQLYNSGNGLQYPFSTTTGGWTMVFK